MAPKEKRGRPESKSRMMSVIKKKKKTLMKKADELSIFCGVEACVISLSSETSECNVWSSTPDALSMLKRYRELKTEDKSKRKVDLTDVMRQRIDEVKKKLEIQRKKNLELELQNKLLELKNLSVDGLPLQSLQENLSLIDKTLEKVREQISTLRKVAIGSVPQAYDTLCSSLPSSDPQNIQLD
ncbi:agamous-like MADS-box protein AGL36 [Magnolia sinica]|uniref:agamous-like MADS-box protein AGL36 n=1 Tax=Magnolia sinica TaxID=86752 RepID=UPI00265AF8BA|nr:agamous-like MADS-box protein AGL36 [Magnolia sinica]